MGNPEIYRPNLIQKNPRKVIKVDERGVVLTPGEMKAQRENPDPREQK